MSHIIIDEMAFAKLAWFRLNCNENNVCNYKLQNPGFLEVSLMGVSKSEEEINYITDFFCIPQEASAGLTEPTDEGIAKYFEDMFLDQGIPPVLCGRFWAHTHPGTSPTPSGTDNETFFKWFKDSDWGVMYILANGDDSCHVKYGTKYFGTKIEEMPVFIALNRVDNHGNRVCVTTETLFSVDKVGRADGYKIFNISNLLMEDYSHLHEEWMAELKANVKKKHQTTHYTPHTTAISKHNPQQQTQQTGQTQSPIDGTGQTSTNIVSSGFIRAATIIRILVLNKVDTINALGKKGLEAICHNYKCGLKDIQTAYNNIKTFEKTIQPSDLLPFEKQLIDDSGNSNVDNLSEEKMLLICEELLIRPACLKETVEFYIKQTKEFAANGK